jgi:hypothetical protein
MPQRLRQDVQQYLRQHLPEQTPQHLAYVLPRAVLVLLGWGVTYWILTALSTHLPPAVVYITGISWMLAGAVGFGYLYRLRREAGLLPGPPAGTRQ